MKRFFLIPNPQKDKDLSVTRRVLAVLREIEGSTVYMQEPYLTLCDGERVFVCPDGECPPDAEAVLTIGGDGTVLNASRIALRRGIPLLGINLGRLGYLAELDADRLEELRRLADDSFVRRDVMVLKTSLKRGDKIWQMPRLSVNDIIFYRSATGHMIDLTLVEDGSGSMHYLSDGLVIATPTGSTAYALSAGGPILPGTFDCISATPVCPHSFFNRTVIFDGGATLTVRNNASGGENVLVTLDGHENFMMEPQDEVILERASVRLAVLSPDKRNFLKTLRKKMRLTE